MDSQSLLFPETQASLQEGELEIAYKGPALESTRASLFLLADAYRGLGSLADRTGVVLFGSDVSCVAELRLAPRRGSVIIPIHFLATVAERTDDALKSLPAVALYTLLSVLGFDKLRKSTNVFQMFRDFSGRKTPQLERRLPTPETSNAISSQVLYKLHDDDEIRAALRRLLRPLRTEGVVAFETLVDSEVIEEVTESDLFKADDAELDQIAAEEEKDLEIQKAALVRHLSWHFSDDNSSFDAQIQDDDLWQRVERGERFGQGDRMRVALRTSAKRDQSGRLRVERTIPKVLDVEHRRQQSLLPDDVRS